MSTLEQFTRSLRGSAATPTLEFARTYPTGAEDLWSALTQPERLARWLGRFVGAAPQQVGDEFDLDLGGGEEDRAHGRVTVCRSPVELACDWVWQDEVGSTLTVRLEPIEQGGTRLMLEHRLGEAAHVVGYGGGWEQCLLALDDEVTGTTAHASSLSDHEAHAQEEWRRLQRQTEAG